MAVSGRFVRSAARVITALAALTTAGDAFADGPLGPNGAPITTSDYRVDLFQGPVLATTQILGMGGAVTALAEGAQGIPFNPAAVSVRAPYSTTRADYDLTGGLTLPTSVTDTDFDNNGDTAYQTKNFLWGTAGGSVQVDRLGMGAMLSGQNYVLDQPSIIRIPDIPEAADRVIVRILKLDAVASYGFLDEQLHIGGGLRTVFFRAVGSARDAGPTATTSADLTGDSRERLLFSTNAFGVQGGVLWTPRKLPLRVGGTLRSPLLGEVDETESRFKADAVGDFRAGDFYLPKKVDLPWEIEAGVAVQLWKRPLNLPWYDEDKVPEADSERWRRSLGDGRREPAYKGARRMLAQRYRELPREKVLLSTSVLVTGPVANAVGFESMLARRVERSGESASVSVRAGVETEVIPFWLVLRAGSYLEPTRFRDSSARMHATAGLQARLFRWDVFGLMDEHTIIRGSLAADIARDYFAWSVGLGYFR